MQQHNPQDHTAARVTGFVLFNSSSCTGKFNKDCNLLPIFDQSSPLKGKERDHEAGALRYFLNLSIFSCTCQNLPFYTMVKGRGTVSPPLLSGNPTIRHLINVWEKALSSGERTENGEEIDLGYFYSSGLQCKSKSYLPCCLVQWHDFKSIYWAE